MRNQVIPLLIVFGLHLFVSNEDFKDIEQDQARAKAEQAKKVKQAKSKDFDNLRKKAEYMTGIK